MCLEDVILVGSVREKVRTHALTTNPTAVMDRIKAWVPVGPRGRPVGVPVPVFTAPSPVPVGVPAYGVIPPQEVFGDRMRGVARPAEELQSSEHDYEEVIGIIG